MWRILKRFLDDLLVGRTIQLSRSESEMVAGWEGLVATARVENFLLKKVGDGEQREQKGYVILLPFILAHLNIFFSFLLLYLS